MPTVGATEEAAPLSLFWFLQGLVWAVDARLNAGGGGVYPFAWAHFLGSCVRCVSGGVLRLCAVTIFVALPV